MNKYQNQKIKFFYYLFNTVMLLVPRIFYRWMMKPELRKIDFYDKNYVLSRVSYYNKMDKSFKTSDNSVTCEILWDRQKTILKNYFLKNDKSKKKLTSYFFPLYNIFSYFPKNKRLDFKFGDVRETFSAPTIVKSRPIANSHNSIIMKLEEVRHFNFINDKLNFREKSDKAVWRGYSGNNKMRLHFLKKYHNVPIFDIGQHSPVEEKPWYKGYMSIKDQLTHKFIFCIEGWDTATSMKWVMSSNSLCVMPKPKYETWFMEGSLKPDKQYVQVSDDFSDAEDKINFYLSNPDVAINIIKKAHEHVDQFRDLKREKLISMLVLKKYFSFSG